MRIRKHKQGLTVITLGVALGAAIYLNWEYSKAEPPVVETAVPTAVTVVEEPFTQTTESVPDKNYGEAQLVSIGQNGSNSFFTEARLNRTKSRDEALDTLKKTLKGSSLTAEEKAQLTGRLNTELDSITSESEIESLIKAKGFVDSVVYVDGPKVQVTVMTENDGLTKGEVAQIRDIVLSKCSTTAQNITVVEVK